MSEASARYEWQDHFGAVVDQLEAAYPERFAEARIGADHRGAEISFIGAVPAQARGLVASVPVPVRLRVSNGTVPTARLDAEMRTAYRRIWSDPAVANASSGFDVETTSIWFRVQPARPLAELGPAERQALLDHLAQLAPSGPEISSSFSLTHQVGGFWAG